MSDRAQADGNPDAAAPLLREVEIVNKKGLHARASAKFVQTAEKFEGTEITVTRVHDSGTHESVGGTSIMGLMMLAAGPGVTITIAASGPDAAAALDALCALVASRFGEDD
jgi:phosphocarrier protein HPr